MFFVAADADLRDDTGMHMSVRTCTPMSPIAEQRHNSSESAGLRGPIEVTKLVSEMLTRGDRSAVRDDSPDLPGRIR
jgi:hypothetical protein